MYKNKRVLALIPARGGSKGLPKKNIRGLLGKPVIAWTIEQAKESKYLDGIVVSTDSEEIAGVSKKYGAQVPFLRPAKLAGDSSPVCEGILHAQRFFEEKKDKYDIIVLLECTSPMRYQDDIDNIIEKLVVNTAAGSVVGVVKVTNEHPLWMFKLNQNYLVNFIEHSIPNLNRQRLQKLFLPYSIYATWWDNFKKYKTFYQPNTLAYLLRREQKVDIDDEVDFCVAEGILKKYLKLKERNHGSF